jgi:D-3-phosphoglycerate dehydrogenase
MINPETLTLFKPGSVLINTARGEIVDENALAAALADGRLAGAALDVFAAEPLVKDHPLVSAPNTLLTPHIGARTLGGLERMNDVVDDVIRVLQGRTPRYPA